MSLSAHAQFTDSTTGLFSAPSADMNASGTFMITNNFLNEHFTPDTKSEFPWDYHTFSYGFSITFWSRLEVAYVCTLFNGAWSPSATEYRQKIVKNQDRHFAAKLLLLEEGQFNKSWIPAIAVGICDPVSGINGDYLDQKPAETGNGFFNRYYAMATKHFQTSFGEVGAHLGYQYSVRRDWNRKGVIAAVDWPRLDSEPLVLPEIRSGV